MTCHPDGFRRATFGVATRLFYDALLEDAAGVAANTEVLDLACGPGLPTVTGGWSTVVWHHANAAELVAALRALHRLGTTRFGALANMDIPDIPHYVDRVPRRRS